MSKKTISEKFEIWIDARKRFHLSHVQIQMARELGLNPKKFGKLNNSDQEPWKLPLPQFIEHIYYKRLIKGQPSWVMSIEERARLQTKKKLQSGRENGELLNEKNRIHTYALHFSHLPFKR